MEETKTKESNVVRNLSRTAGGADIPDASDIPGGALGTGDDLLTSALKAFLSEQEDKGM